MHVFIHALYIHSADFEINPSNEPIHYLQNQDYMNRNS